MNMFFVPQLGSMVATMNGMVTQLWLQADQTGELYGQSSQFSGDGFAGMNFIVHAVPPDRFQQWVAATRQTGPRARRSGLPRAVAAEPERGAVHLSVGRGQSVRRHRQSEIPAGPRPAGKRRRRRPFAQQEELTNVFGKLTWDAVPWSQPIPLVAGGVVILAVLAVLLWVVVRGYLPYLWNEWITSVDHKRIGVMYLLLALLMLLRGFIDAHHDALAAGGRLSRRRLFAAGAFRSDLLGARHDHDLLRRHAVDDRPDELRRAAAARRARRRFPDVELDEFLAHRDRRPLGQSLARRRRVRAHRMAALSAAVGGHLSAGGRGRLLPVGACRSPVSAR